MQSSGVVQHTPDGKERETATNMHQNREGLAIGGPVMAAEEHVRCSFLYLVHSELKAAYAVVIMRI
jgi:hypothetical protein